MAWPSWREAGFVVVLAVLFSELASAAPSGTDLATPAFGAAATFAALFLPAAGLAQQFSGAGIEGLAREMVTYQADLAHLEAIKKVVERWMGGVKPLPSAFVMFLGALFVAAVALFEPSPEIVDWSWRPLQVPMHDVLVGTAVALDVVAACKLFPFTMVLVDQKNHKAVLATIESLIAAARAAQAPPAAEPPAGE
jgi:hypothetical protein